MVTAPLRSQESVTKGGVTTSTIPFSAISNLDSDAVPVRQHTVTAQQLQARIKAARLNKVNNQPLPEDALRKLNQPRGSSRPRARSISATGYKSARGSNHDIEHGSVLSFDAVVQSLQAEVDKWNLSTEDLLLIQGGHFSHLTPPRPRPYRTGTSRSSVTMRKSPVFSIAILEETADQSAELSGDSSASSRRQSISAGSDCISTASCTSESLETSISNHPSPGQELGTSRARLTKRNHSQTSEVLKTESEVNTSKTKWHSPSRKSLFGAFY